MLGIAAVLDILGFILSGIGSVFFFFIYAFITKASVLTDMANVYINHSVSIRKYWLKNINGESNLVVDDKKLDWTKKKKFAFWAVEKGSTWSFALVAIGFVLQLIAKFF